MAIQMMTERAEHHVDLARSRHTLDRRRPATPDHLVGLDSSACRC